MSTPDYFVSRADADTYEPQLLPDGRQLGEMHWLRRADDADGSLTSGIWRVDPADLVGHEDLMDGGHDVATNETVYILQGGMRYEYADGSVVELGPGDRASFVKGSRMTRWEALQPTVLFFVYSS